MNTFTASNDKYSADMTKCSKLTPADCRSHPCSMADDIVVRSGSPDDHNS
jgi:hypothetical protein